MAVTNTNNKRGSNRTWIVPVVLIILLTLGVGTYFVLGYIDRQEKIAESIRIQESIQESIRAELDEMSRFLARDTFYEGIFLDDVDLSGKTLNEAKELFRQRDKAWREQFAIELRLEDEARELTANEIGLWSDWEEVLDQAWQVGRGSQATDEADQIRERYAAVTELLAKPKTFFSNRSFDPTAVRSAVLKFAESLYVEPRDAEVTGFEFDAKQFTVAESVPGRAVDGETAAEAVIRSLEGNKPVADTFSLLGTIIEPELDAATLKSRLGLVSEAVTTATNNANRNHNITLICRALNGTVLQPGESFSFNGRVGRRTAAKGYREAGGIINGILIDTFGGGICQPNTTLCQAVLKADLQIDERHPHSWPSSYTTPGLDATVSWGGPDFKFTNNTEYPIAIVAWFSNPRVNFRIYGRLFEEGVSIKLDTKVTQVTPVTREPEIRFNPGLRPGTQVELRKAYTGQKITAYKVWIKNGRVIEREVAFHSNYPPLHQILEVGPPLPTPSETSEPTTGEPTTSATTPEPTSPETSEPTTGEPTTSDPTSGD